MYDNMISSRAMNRLHAPHRPDSPAAPTPLSPPSPCPCEATLPHCCCSIVPQSPKSLNPEGSWGGWEAGRWRLAVASRARRPDCLRAG